MENKPPAQGVCTTNVHLVKDEKGNWTYPATQRQDGTWRKSLRVKCGHQEEEQLSEKYVIKQRREDLETTEVNMSENKIKTESCAGAQGSVLKKAAHEKMTSLPPINTFLLHQVPPMPERPKEGNMVAPLEPQEKAGLEQIRTDQEASSKSAIDKNEMGSTKPKNTHSKLDEVDNLTTDDRDPEDVELQKTILMLRQLHPNERAEAWNRLARRRLYELYEA